MSGAMPQLARRIALDATGPALSSASALVTINVLPPRARFVLRIDASLLSGAGTLAGFALDLPINRCSARDGRSTMRLGPDEWLLIGPAADAERIDAELRSAFVGRHHALVDISHRQVAFSVSGPKAADVINAGCPLDFAATVFTPGHATRTLLGKAEIVLCLSTDPPNFALECGRSYAMYVRDFLHEAAREFA
jgi:sarcosine oxidase subunit gamma